MTVLYSHPLSCHATPRNWKGVDPDSHLVETADNIAASMQSPFDLDLRSNAIRSVSEMTWNLARNNTKRLCVWATSAAFEGTIINTISNVRWLAELLKDRGVRQHQFVSDAVHFLGYNLICLPVSLDKRSVVHDEVSGEGIQFEHLLQLPAVCRRDMTPWPYVYKCFRCHDLYYDDFDDRRNCEKQQPMVTHFLETFFERLGDNYARCKVCLDAVLRLGLTPRQLTLRTNPANRKGYLLGERDRHEIERDPPSVCDVDLPSCAEEVFGSNSLVIAVQTATGIIPHASLNGFVNPHYSPSL
ncbi:hypothetical protein [Rhodopirellula bahusiensis]|uniref:hypothetical protein n=1 Tax=Rhodopirellula bahusiensis TaxID=2014065 RepID=UPI00326410E5